MEYKKVKLNGFDLHLLKTTRFKTVTVEINFNNIIKKEDVTKSSLLTKILSFSCNKYPTKKLLQIKKEDLYGLTINNSSYRVGNYLSFDFDMTFLESEFSSNTILEESLELLKELVYNPLKEGKGFDKKVFNIAKNIQRSIIDSEEENKTRIATIKMLEAYDEKSPVSYRKNGYIEDLEEITSDNLFEYYENLLTKSKVNIFVVGNIDYTEIEKTIKKKFRFALNDLEESLFLLPKKPRNKVREVVLKEKTNQAKLSIGCTVNDLNNYESDYILSLYNLILGGSADSLFFKNIREKHSLCYSISSSTNRLDNILIIQAGFVKSNYNKMISLIKKEMKAIQKGDITDADLEKEKKYACSSIEDIFDSPNKIINYYYMVAMLGMESLEIRKDKIMKIVKEDIIRVANKVKIDTICLLGGD